MSQPWHLRPEFSASYPDAGYVPSTFPDADAVKRTLALRLEIDEPQAVDNLWRFIKRTAPMALQGTGESQVLERYRDQIILLDTEGLGLFDFSPSEETRKKVDPRSYRAAVNYLR